MSEAFTCERQTKHQTSDGIGLFCGTVTGKETKDCVSCCIKCSHAMDMDCFMVCSKVAGYYHPVEEG